MNIILAQDCNNSCPYCFQKEERTNRKHNYISLENSILLGQWLLNANVQNVSLIGGEPFLHPNLKEVIQNLITNNPNLKISIFTGGIINEKLINKLPNKNITILFNLNEPQYYRNEQEYIKVLSNIELAIRRGNRVNIGYNIWELGFNTKYIVDLAYKFGRTSFRWTVANPISGIDSNVISPDDFKLLSRSCTEMLDYASLLNINAILDCPLPLCFFNEKDFAKIFINHPDTLSQLGKQCRPVLDVTPELEVIRCFSMSNVERKSLMSFNTENEIEDYYKHSIDDCFTDKIVYKECQDCHYFWNNKCAGGCLGWRNTKYESLFTTPAALSKYIYKTLSDDLSIVALAEFHKSPTRLKSPLNYYLAAVAAKNLSLWEESFGLGCRALAYARDEDLKQKIQILIKGIPSQLIKGFNDD